MAPMIAPLDEIGRERLFSFGLLQWIAAGAQLPRLRELRGAKLSIHERHELERAIEE